MYLHFFWPKNAKIPADGFAFIQPIITAQERILLIAAGSQHIPTDKFIGKTRGRCKHKSYQVGRNCKAGTID